MIRLTKLSKHYGDFVAVDEVSLEVAQGELLVLLGGSGSGKTTTLKMINRLIEPTSGTIKLDGVDIRTLSDPELRRKIGYAFQKIGLFPHMTVAENIGITCKLIGWDTARIEKRVDELLERVELDPKIVRERLPSELSGGQQQRIGVARALAAEPKVMLLDEPFGALDPLTRDSIQQFFLKLRREIGLTAVFVTHDMVEALILGDKIAVMEEGKLAQLGTPRQLLLEPANEYVASLMGTPKQQAKFLDDLLKSEAP